MAPTRRQDRIHQTRITFMVACALLATVGAGGCSRSDAAAKSRSQNDTPSSATSQSSAKAVASADGRLHAQRPWVRATPPNAPVAGGYVTLRNDGSIDDRLLSISSPDAKRVEIHEMREADGTMQMRQLADGVAVQAGSIVTLEPGGIHLMFIGPTHPFEPGDTVNATLTYAHATEESLEFPVQPLGATMAPGAAKSRDSH